MDSEGAKVVMFYHLDISSFPDLPDLPDRKTGTSSQITNTTTHEGYSTVTLLPHNQCAVTLTVENTVDK